VSTKIRWTCDVWSIDEGKDGAESSRAEQLDRNTDSSRNRLQTAPGLILYFFSTLLTLIAERTKLWKLRHTPDSLSLRRTRIHMDQIFNFNETTSENGGPQHFRQVPDVSSLAFVIKDISVILDWCYWYCSTTLFGRASTQSLNCDDAVEQPHDSACAALNLVFDRLPTSARQCPNQTVHICVLCRVDHVYSTRDLAGSRTYSWAIQHTPHLIT